MTPTISVVMTTYNRERYLGHAIESVLAQTRQDFELVVWDDGSTDRSVEIALSYAKRDPRVLVVAAEHLGQAGALKASIAKTTGSYIGQVDSDDFLAPTALAETSSILDNYSDVGLVYTDYLVMDKSGWIKGEGSQCQIPYSKDRLLVDFMTFHFRLIRRSVYNQAGGVNELFEFAEDYELCLRLSEITEVWQLKKPLYYYRIHEDSLSHHKRIEQILQSQKAITQALERRGLSDQLESKVKIMSQFYLCKKH